MTTRSKRNVKCLSAVIGGSAVIALGALSMALGHEQAGPPADVAGSKMTVGQTSTETTAPGVPVISMAVPAIKGPAPLPSEDQGVPG
jgi:hypothetical protein